MEGECFTFNDMQTNANRISFRQLPTHFGSRKRDSCFLLHFKRKILRYICTINICFYFYRCRCSISVANFVYSVRYESCAGCWMGESLVDEFSRDGETTFEHLVHMPEATSIVAARFIRTNL